MDGMIEQASKTMREGGQSFETLQRQERTVDDKPAQMLKVRYHEKATTATGSSKWSLLRVPTARSIRWR